MGQSSGLFELFPGDQTGLDPLNSACKSLWVEAFEYRLSRGKKTPWRVISTTATEPFILDLRAYFAKTAGIGREVGWKCRRINLFIPSSCAL